MTAFYCVRERRKVEVAEDLVQRDTRPNGRPVLIAICPSCGAKLLLIVSR